MRILPALFIATLIFLSAQAEATVRSFSKGQLLKEIAAWQEDIVDFEDPSEKETKIRQDWLFRLQFLVERRYDGTENSLHRILKFMVELDKRGDPHTKSDETLMVQRLLEAIDMVRERHEPLWRFVQSYVEDIDPSRPPKLDEFAKSRDYINNFQGITAKKISPEDLEKLLTSLEQPLSEKSKVEIPVAK